MTSGLSMVLFFISVFSAGSPSRSCGCRLCRSQCFCKLGMRPTLRGNHDWELGGGSPSLHGSGVPQGQQHLPSSWFVLFWQCCSSMGSICQCACTAMCVMAGRRCSGGPRAGCGARKQELEKAWRHVLCQWCMPLCRERSGCKLDMQCTQECTNVSC